MGPGRVGADGGCVAIHVEQVGGGETGSVHLLCMGGGPAVGKPLRLIGAGIVAATVRAFHDFK